MTGKIDYSRLAIPKPEPRSRTKRRAKRQDGLVAKLVRAGCVVRDGHCRLAGVRWHTCDGPSEWAHLVPRSKTRGMASEYRHATRSSLMLCRLGHAQLDCRVYPRLLATPLTRQGADGRLLFEQECWIYGEP